MTHIDSSIYQFTIRELSLMAVLIVMWLGISVLLGPFGPVFWGLGVVMATVLRPTHQRRRIPDSATDVLSVAVSWSVACGILGIGVDLLTSGGNPTVRLSWALIGELMGFYLGLVWTLVLLLYRHVERVTGRVDNSRPLI